MTNFPASLAQWPAVVTTSTVGAVGRRARADVVGVADAEEDLAEPGLRRRLQHRGPAVAPPPGLPLLGSPGADRGRVLHPRRGPVLLDAPLLGLGGRRGVLGDRRRAGRRWVRHRGLLRRCQRDRHGGQTARPVTSCVPSSNSPRVRPRRGAPRWRRGPGRNVAAFARRHHPPNGLPSGRRSPGLTAAAPPATTPTRRTLDGARTHLPGARPGSYRPDPVVPGAGRATRSRSRPVAPARRRSGCSGCLRRATAASSRPPGAAAAHRDLHPPGHERVDAAVVGEGAGRREADGAAAPAGGRAGVEEPVVGRRGVRRQVLEGPGHRLPHPDSDLRRAERHVGHRDRAPGRRLARAWAGTGTSKAAPARPRPRAQTSCPGVRRWRTAGFSAAQPVPQHLGDEERQLEGLHAVEPRVADRLVAVREVDLARAPRRRRCTR